jgi:hypothetical protein
MSYRYFECWDELELRDVVDEAFHHLLNLIAVRLLQWSKAANIK